MFLISNVLYATEREPDLACIEGNRVTLKGHCTILRALEHVTMPLPRLQQEGDTVLLAEDAGVIV
jgi:hypothetical protein